MTRTSWGIRIRRPDGSWQRGKQFRRAKTSSGWVEWRQEWPTRAAALLRLAQYRAAGFRGHVFPIDAPAEVITYPTATHYSPNFTRAELECKGRECDGKRPPAWIEQELTILATGLEQLRTQLGTPLGIMSGYRCPIRNEDVGGATRSQHMEGTAADLVVPRGEQDRFNDAAERVPMFDNGGIGTYVHGGVHVDHRPYRARWNSWSRA